MANQLIVVDMQNDFVKGHMSTPEAEAIIPAVVEKVRRYREAGDPVLFTMDTHLDADYREESPTAEAAALPKHCIRGTDGWRILDELRPYVQACTLEKPTFLGLELDEALPELGKDEENVIELCGVCTDICVISNALYLRARYPRARILVDGACCAGVSPASHAAALTAMRSCLIEVV